MELRARAAAAGLPSHIIVDAGRASGSVTRRFKKRCTESRSEYAMKWQSGALGDQSGALVQRLLLGPLLGLFIFSAKSMYGLFLGQRVAFLCRGAWERITIDHLALQTG
jgi:hypothetical protein